MSVFDCDEYLEALERPVVKLNGQVYEGNLLSITEYMKFAQPYDTAIKAAREGKMDAFVQFAEQYLYALFPKKNVPFWRPDLKADDIVPELLKQPGLLHMVIHFFGLQGKAIVENPMLTPMKTNGTDSQDNQSVSTETTTQQKE